MKFVSVMLMLVMMLPACMRHERVSLPEDLNFSVLHFNGNVIHNSASLPVQGALTHKGRDLKFVIMSQTGILLGHGLLDSYTGNVHVAFSRSMMGKNLIQETGYALAIILPVMPQLSEEYIIPPNLQLPQKWKFLPEKNSFFYHDGQLSLFIPRESIQ